MYEQSIGEVAGPEMGSEITLNIYMSYIILYTLYVEIIVYV